MPSLELSPLSGVSREVLAEFVKGLSESLYTIDRWFYDELSIGPHQLLLGTTSYQFLTGELHDLFGDDIWILSFDRQYVGYITVCNVVHSSISSIRSIKSLLGADFLRPRIELISHMSRRRQPLPSMCSDTDLYISRLFISSPFRGKGFGSFLIDLLLDKFHGLNFLLHVNRGNDAALSLYRKKGFFLLSSSACPPADYDYVLMYHAS